MKKEKGISLHLIDMIRSLYDGSNVKIKMDNKFSENEKKTKNQMDRVYQKGVVFISD